MDLINYEKIKDLEWANVSPWAKTNLNQQKSSYLFPDFEKHSDNPIISGNSETGNQAGFCSPIYVGGILSEPIDDFYMFWAGHDGGGIWLSTAPHPLGPWTEWGKLFDVNDVGEGDHVSSPDVIYVPENDTLRLYYHRAHSNDDNDFVQETEYAEHEEMNDGTTFSFPDDKTVISADYDGSWDEQEVSYARVIRINNEYLFTYQGRDRENNVKGIGLQRSNDGKGNDGKMLAPVFYNTEFQEEYGPDVEVGASPNIIKFNNINWLLFVDGGSPRIIKSVPLEDPYRKFPKTKTLLEPTQDWETDTDTLGLEAPSVLFWNGTIYLYYNSVYESSQDDEREIGVAYYNFKE